MKTTFRLARLELSTLFYSPIAWLVWIVFSFQSGLGFTDKLKTYAASQEAGGKLTFLTETIFGGPFGFFADIQKNVYLYIPLLTMGLMSRETSSGSIKLLQSSPVKIREIVLGKFLAMMGYCLLLVLTLALFSVAGTFSIRAFGWQFVVSGLAGIYLLICAYSAIGLFMSSLTTYQVVAAISTLVVLAALNYVGLLWQDVDFVRDITWFLSISGRVDQMRDGLITSPDILYFILVILLFLGLTMLLLRAGRESSSIWTKTGRYLGFILLMLLTGYISSRPRWALYLDMTATKDRTLTPASQAIIKKLKSPLKVTTYTNLLDDFWYQGMPSARNKDVAFWSSYQRFMPGMQLNYVYYYDTSKADWLFRSNKGVSVPLLAKRMAKARELNFQLFMSPEDIKKTIDLTPEEHRFVRCLEYGGKRTFLREYQADLNPNPGEAEVLAGIKRLLVAPPKVGFLTGDNERSIGKAGDKDYNMLAQLTFRHSLVNQGFDVTTLSLEKDDVPADVTVLVIADPRKHLTADKIQRIHRYIRQGGNLLVAGEPGRQGIINPLLDSFGVRLMDGMLLQESKDFSPDLVTGLFTTEMAGHFGEFKPLRADSARVSMPGAAGLSYRIDGIYKNIPLLATDKGKSWNEKGKIDMDTGDIHFTPLRGDVKASLPLALALSKDVNGRQQRVVILGDADCMSMAELSRSNIRVANFIFMMRIFKWLGYDEFPIDMSRPPSADNKMFIDKNGVLAWKIIFLAALPGLLLLAGTMLLISRRRR